MARLTATINPPASQIIIQRRAGRAVPGASTAITNVD
jgi:hypothetical protein